MVEKQLGYKYQVYNEIKRDHDGDLFAGICDE